MTVRTRSGARPFRLELYRMTRRPRTALLVLAIILCFKGVVLLAGGGESAAAGRGGSAFIYLAESASMTLKLGWLLLLCFAAASVSGDRSRGMLRMLLARPVDRVAFLLSRSASLLVVGGLILLADGLVGTGYALLFKSFSDVADPALQGPQFAASAMIWQVVRAYLMTYLGFAATLSLGLFVSTLCAHPTPAIAWAAGSGLALEGLRLVFGGDLGACIMTGYNSLHFERLSRLARGIAEYTPDGFFLMAAAVPIVHMLVLTTGAIVALRKADLVE